jgi:hypothetical protein
MIDLHRRICRGDCGMLWRVEECTAAALLAWSGSTQPTLHPHIGRGSRTPPLRCVQHHQQWRPQASQACARRRPTTQTRVHKKLHKLLIIVIINCSVLLYERSEAWMIYRRRPLPCFDQVSQHDQQRGSGQ